LQWHASEWIVFFSISSATSEANATHSNLALHTRLQREVYNQLACLRGGGRISEGRSNALLSEAEERSGRNGPRNLLASASVWRDNQRILTRGLYAWAPRPRSHTLMPCWRSGHRVPSWAQLTSIPSDRSPGHTLMHMDTRSARVPTQACFSELGLKNRRVVWNKRSFTDQIRVKAIQCGVTI